MAVLYNADQVTGRDLYALTPVPLTSDGMDKTKPFAVIPAGDRVGTVESWVGPKAGRKRLQWMFYDESGRAFFAEHFVGRFDIGTLRDQGALSVIEQIAQEKADREPLKTKIFTFLKWGVGIGVAAYLANSFIRSRSYPGKK